MQSPALFWRYVSFLVDCLFSFDGCSVSMAAWYSSVRSSRHGLVRWWYIRHGLSQLVRIMVGGVSAGLVLGAIVQLLKPPSANIFPSSLNSPVFRQFCHVMNLLAYVFLFVIQFFVRGNSLNGTEIFDYSLTESCRPQRHSQGLRPLVYIFPFFLI